jgi:hypothetical protein
MSYSSNSSIRSARGALDIAAKARIRSCVTLCRAARRLKDRSTRAPNAEAESIERAAEALLEHASLNGMKPSFVACETGSHNRHHATLGTSALLSANDSSSDSSADDDDTTTTTTTSAHGSGFHYTLSVRFANTESTAKLNITSRDINGRAERCLRDCFSALAHRKRSKNSVSLGRCDTTFDADANAYNVDVQLWPPTADQEEATLQQRKRRELETKSSAAQHVNASLPNADECLSFYSNRPDLWSMFGADIGEVRRAKRRRRK